MKREERERERKGGGVKGAMAVRRRRKEGWSTTREAERSKCNSEGEVKEESRRRKRGGRACD